MFMSRTVGVPEPLHTLEERRRGTRFIELPSRSIINSPESTGMGFWSINPYVGCEFGCSYCYARYAHRYVVDRARDTGRLDEPTYADVAAPLGLEGFEHRIFVKRRNSVLAALDADLRKVRHRAARDGMQNLVIGTATDPYQPAERQYQITRTILERLRAERGLRIGLITKSPSVVRDLGLLRQVALRNVVSVYVSLISADIGVIKRFEARSPMPHVRLRALKRLVDGGLRAGLIVAPVLPGITDSRDQIERLMQAARDAGARFVFPSVLRLYPDVASRFLPLLEQSAPELAKRYRTRYGQRWDAPAEYLKAVRQRFRSIAARYGIADTDGASEQPAGEGTGAGQLSFWS
jgi:DNA repair photolyase